MSVDTSIGDYKEPVMDEIEDKKIVDNRLLMIQNEDQSRTFTDIMKNADDNKTDSNYAQESYKSNDSDTKSNQADEQINTTQGQDTVYKVYIGSYSSAEQAKVVKEIIQESATGLTPIVKCIGLNNYTLQVGIFKNKSSAEAMLKTVKSENLPGRIVQEN